MNRKKQFDSLTALKGLFIILIALHNSLNLNSLFDNVPGTSFIRLFGGELGDALFFILSGFLFSYSYRERIQSGLISFQSFILRRLQKLFPLYIVSNFVSLILVIIQHGISAAPLTKTMFTVLLQMGGGLHIGVPYNSPTWFLSTLFVCYICFFFICFHAKNPTAYYCMITFGIIWGYTLQKVNWNLPFGYPSTGLGLMNFFIGCILSEMSPPRGHSCKIHCLLQLTALCVLLSSFYLMLHYGVEIICGDIGVAFSFLICPLILYLAYTEGPCRKLLSLKPFVWLGKISISIFFWHMPVYYIFELVFTSIAHSTAIQESHYILYFILMLVFSTLSHYLLEKKLFAFK